MSRTLHRILLMVSFLTTSLFVHAAHIIGGDVVYQCISTNTATESTRFQITFTMYRDPFGGGATFDNDAEFGLFKSAGNNQWEYVTKYIADPTNISIVPFQLECVVLPPNIGVEKAIYQFEVEIPWSNDTYQIVYQRCCRNGSINNLINPAQTGAAFFVELSSDAVRNCNNSPSFKNFPPVLICNGKPINFDHSATDADGDQLTYELCAPLSAGGTQGVMGGNPQACDGVRPLPDNCPPPFNEVQYITGVYSGSNPMGGNPVVNINSNSGLINGVPIINGQFVVGVCVKEFRNGELIGTIRRDFQFNVTDCQGITQSINAALCTGDTIAINDSIYTVGGNYTQVLQTSEGCDSVLSIVVKESSPQSGSMDYTICRGDGIVLNGYSYNTEGVFEQNLTTQAGCDSTLQVNIRFHPEPQGQLSYEICEGASVIVNDSIYSFEGNYIQNLTSSKGCDSILNISIKTIPASEAMLSYSLCDDNEIVVNGSIYNTAGQYIQNLTTTKGCDSILVINISGCNKSFGYDFELCNAQTPSASMDYAEFTPIYSNVFGCGTIQATNVFRPQPNMNKHSCTEGRNGSIAMCVSAATSCDANTTAATPVTFEVTLNPSNGYDFHFNKLVFYQKAPTNYAWIGGNSGINNYPTKFNMVVYKDGNEIFKQQGLSTTTDWSEVSFDFNDDEKFTAPQSAVFRVELLPYCQAGINSTVSVWDIDDVEVFTSCINTGNRAVSGIIDVINIDPEAVQVKAFNDHHYLVVKPDAQGNFIFNELQTDHTYTIEVFAQGEARTGLNVLDLVAIQRHILNMEKMTSFTQLRAADINGDQKISGSDLVDIRKVILGLSNAFSRSASYAFLNNESLSSARDAWSVSTKYAIKPGLQNLSTIRFTTVKMGDVIK